MTTERNPFGARGTVSTDEITATYYSLRKLEDEKLTDGVEVLERVAPLLHDGATAQGRNAATDNPKGFARGVIIDARHHQAAAGRWPVH